MENFRKLKVWEKAHALTLDVYALTKGFPDHERFGLISQMRRAASSVPTNIAEGADRSSMRDRKHFHEIARTSLEELKYQIILCHDLKYLTTSDGRRLMEAAREIGKMLHGLDRSL